MDFRWEYSLNTVNSQQHGEKPSFIISLDVGKITEKLLLFARFCDNTLRDKTFLLPALKLLKGFS